MRGANPGLTQKGKEEKTMHSGRFRYAVLFIVLALLVVAVPPARGQSTDSSRAVADKMSGRGAMQLTRLSGTIGDLGTPRFRAELQPEGAAQASLSGTVTLKGVSGWGGGPLGDVEWKRDGTQLTGTVTRAGQKIAQFSGVIGATSASGSFTATNGAMGSWSWDGESAASAE